MHIQKNYFLKIFAITVISGSMILTGCESVKQTGSVSEYEQKTAEGNYTQAFAYLKEAAEKGSGREMTMLGTAYLYGRGTEQDYAQALKWFTKAAAAGFMKAPRYIGMMYENGYGVPIDYAKAFSYYSQAAEGGDITGSYLLGSLYERGLGTAQDYTQAFTWYTKAAERGDRVAAPGMRALASLYARGLGVEKDSEKAVELVKKADASEEEEGVKNVTAVTEVYGDGQKVSAVAIEYTSAINTALLDKSTYEVAGKTITAVYANNALSKTTNPVNGKYVIIELDTAMAPDSGMPAGPQANRQPEQSGNGPMAGGGPKLGEKSDRPAAAQELNATVIQRYPVIDTTGATFHDWSEARTSGKTEDLVVQDFKQFVYTDKNYQDQPLMYNLYIPENYDPAEKYPLVLFMHDAGVVSNNPIETLTQGLGAVVWAEPEEQAEHACFVLAPQYNCVIADDNSETTVQMDITIDLIKELSAQYSIDTNRLYNTGQSMGGMTSIAMDIKYPGFFAASLLVACQWDVSKVAPIADTPLWIVVSEGDIKAYPGQDAITAELEKHGASVTKAVWDAEAGSEELEENVKNMLTGKTSINYTVFKGGSHRYTWQHAYSIAGLRDWLFARSL
ncbi:MAG TPA: hypothetical protein DCL73_10490 [Treponema sp.]|nr:hypothetical protein [Treponema sp.]